MFFFFFFQAEDGIRDIGVTGVQTCALPIYPNQYGLSITLGSAEVTMLDMARVNGTLANHGRLVDLNPILKVSDVKGNIRSEERRVGKECRYRWEPYN